MVDLLVDGCTDFAAGQDASKSVVADNSYYAGVNVSTKKGVIQPRWGFNQCVLEFPEGGIEDRYRRLRSYRELFESGKFQLMASYYSGSDKYILIVIAGTIFLCNLDTFVVTTLELPNGDRLNSRAARLNWCEAGDWFVIYDFPAFPVIIKNCVARRADPAAYEVPVSVIGAYNQNRLFVANAGREFTGGDPFGNTATPDAPITFEEIMLSDSVYFGQIFKLPTAYRNNPITAMGFLQLTDTSTGIGPLLIATVDSICSYNTHNPRSSWESGRFGSTVVYNTGIVGPRAHVNVNSDLFFLSSDGHVRTLAMSRNEQQRWARVPISREVENWMVCNDSSLARYAFLSYFNNKIFIGVNPFRVAALDFTTRLPISDYAHGGMVVLELDNVTSFGESAPPAWAGLWTGIYPMDMIVMDDRCFVISKDSSRINRLYEVDPDLHYDQSGSNIRYIHSRLYTRDHEFKDPYTLKEVHSLDVCIDSMQGDVKVDTKYKPSHSSCYLDWGTFTYKAPWRTCFIPENCFINGYRPHMLRDLTFGSPKQNDTCDPVTGEFYRVFKKLQLQFDIEGAYWELHDYRIKAIEKKQAPTDTVCNEYPAVPMYDVCVNDWYVGDFETCQHPMT